MGSFKSPDRTLKDYTNGLTSLSTDGVAKEGLLKFNPRPGRGVNSGPSGWQSEILPTVPTSHTIMNFNLQTGSLVERDRETERQRETERERQTETDRDRDRDRERQTDRERGGGSY